MNPQIVDLGGLLAVVGILWRIIAATKKDLNARLDRQDEALKEGQASLKEDLAGLKDGQVRMDARLSRVEKNQAGLKSDVAGLDTRLTRVENGQARMGDALIQVVAGLGEVKGELKRIVPREKVGAGGS